MAGNNTKFYHSRQFLEKQVERLKQKVAELKEANKTRPYNHTREFYLKQELKNLQKQKANRERIVELEKQIAELKKEETKDEQ